MLKTFNNSVLPQAQYPEKFQIMSEPQRALISTISAGQEAIESASSLLNEKAKLPALGNDPASVKWKETQWNTNQQAVHSQVSAMNAATAQMVTLTGQDSTDHNAVGAAVNTISTNLPDMAREVKMLAALMDDKGVEGDDLMTAARTLCGAFSDMLTSAAPQTNEVNIIMLSYCKVLNYFLGTVFLPSDFISLLGYFPDSLYLLDPALYFTNL